MKDPHSHFAIRLGIAALLLSAAIPSLAQQPVIPPLKAGFPLVLANQGNDVFSQPIAADLGLTPGWKSIIFGLRNGRLYVIQRNSNGTWGVAPGWPQQLPSHIAASPSVGDLTGDGIAEIVVGFGSTLQGVPPNSAAGGIRAFRRDGTLLWDYQTQDVAEGPDGFRDPVVGAAAIGDVDGDGTNEVVFGGLDFNLYVVEGATGTNQPGWPKFIRDTIFSTPVLYDMDGDNRLDMIVGVDAHAEGPPFNTPDGGCLHVYRYDATGTGQPTSAISEIAGFPKCVDQVIVSSPVVGDIDNDGKPEIVHGTGVFWPGRQQKIYAWNCDGTPVWGTVANPGLAITGQVATTPALADLDGNGQLDVIFTATTTGTPTHRLYAVRGDGTNLFPPIQPRDFFGSSLSAGEPIVADVLGDGALEILVPTNTEAAVFSNTGVQLTETTPHPVPVVKPSFYTQVSLSAVAVTDLETDGAGNQIEVIAVSATPFPSATSTEIHVWNPKPAGASPPPAPPWGFFHRDEKRLGVAPGAGICQVSCADTTSRNLHTLPPCRLLDTRNAAGPLGAPALANGAIRQFSLHGVCGIPASARALSVNLTVTQPTGLGSVRLSPGCTTPSIPMISFATNQTRANNAVLGLDPSGRLAASALVSGSGSVHFIIDVNGYFE